MSLFDVPESVSVTVPVTFPVLYVIIISRFICHVKCVVDFFFILFLSMNSFMIFVQKKELLIYTTVLFFVYFISKMTP